MNKSWQTKRLGEVCEELFAGGDVPKGNSSKLATDEFRIPIFTNGEKNKGLYGYTNVARVTKPSITISARGTIGYSEIREEAFYPAIRLIVVVPKTTIVDLFFLKYVIGCLDIIQSGTSIPQLTVPMIKEYPIPLPPLPEQQRIVKILDEVFAAAAKAKENAEKNLANAAELFQSYLQSVFANPGKGWEEKKFGDIVESNVIGLMRNSKEQDSNHKYVYLKMNNITRTNQLDLAKFVRVNASKTDVEKFSLKAGDFLFNTRNSRELVGKTCIFENGKDEVVLYNNNIMRVRFPKRYSPHFVNYAFTSPFIVDKLESLKSGTTNVWAIYYKDLKNLVLSIPEPKEQHSIVAKLDALSAETKKLEGIYRAKLAALEELKKSVLAKAFSGGM